MALKTSFNSRFFLKTIFPVVCLLTGLFRIVSGDSSLVSIGTNPIAGYGLLSRMMIHADFIQPPVDSDLFEITGEKGFCGIIEKGNNPRETLHWLLPVYYRLFKEKLHPAPFLVIYDTSTGKFWNLFWYPNGKVYGEELPSLPDIEYQIISPTKVVLAKSLDNRVVLTEINENNQCINRTEDDHLLMFLTLQSLNQSSVIRYQNEFGEYVYIFIGADGKVHHLSSWEVQVRYAIYHEQQLEKLIMGEGLPAGGGDLKIKQSMMGRNKPPRKPRSPSSRRKAHSIAPKKGWSQLETGGEPIIDSVHEKVITNRSMIDKDIQLKHLVDSLKGRIKDAFSEKIRRLKKDHSSKMLSAFFYDTYRLLQPKDGIRTSEAQSKFISWLETIKSQAWISEQLLSDQKALIKYFKRLSNDKRCSLVLAIEDIGEYLTDHPTTLTLVLKNLNKEWSDPLDDEVMGDVLYYVEYQSPPIPDPATRPLPPPPTGHYQQPGALSRCESGHYQQPRALSRCELGHYQQPGALSRCETGHYQQPGALSRCETGGCQTFKKPEDIAHYAEARLVPQSASNVKASINIEGVPVVLEGEANEDFASLIVSTLRRQRGSPTTTPSGVSCTTESAGSSCLTHEPLTLAAPPVQECREGMLTLESILHSQQTELSQMLDRLQFSFPAAPNIKEEEEEEDYVIMTHDNAPP